MISLILASLIATQPAYIEERLSVKTSFGNLVGSLMIPSGPGPFPVALIISGSGPTDRNGNSIGLQSDTYKLLARGLAARGIATLRYDKRGIGESADSQPESALRFGDYVDDAVTLSQFVQTDRRFNSVTIVGHSEGALVGMLAAQRDRNVRAFVSLEGPGRNLADIIDSQIQSAGVSANVIDQVVSIDARLRDGQQVGAVDPQLNALFRPSVQPFLISAYKYDPAAEIAKLKIPVLIVQGTTDLQVTLQDADNLAFGNTNSKKVIVDGMNHMLRDAPAERQANIATYNQPSLPLDPKAVDAVASFILSP